MSIDMLNDITRIIGQDIAKMKKVKYGGANLVYDICTVEGEKYILKLYHMKRKFYLIEELNQYLKNNQISGLDIKKSGILNGKYYYLYKKNEGKHKFKYNEKMIKKILEIIHIEYKNKSVSKEYKNNIFEKYDIYMNYFMKNSAKKISLDIIEDINNISKNIAIKRKDYYLVHGDLSLTNLLWTRKNVSIIDFDEAIYAPIEYELVSFIIKTCYKKGRFNKKLAKRIVTRMQLEFDNLNYYELRNNWLLYITKVIYEKFYFYELGYIDIERAEHKKDYWKWWYKLLRDRRVFDEIFFVNCKIDKLPKKVTIKNDEKSQVDIVEIRWK